MRVKKWIIIGSIIIVLAAGVLTGALLLEDSAEQLQAQIYSTYSGMRRNAETTVLTITEGGETVCEYDLKTLGILEQTLVSLDGSFHEYERMAPQRFAGVSMWDKVMWRLGSQTEAAALPVAAEDADLEKIIGDLMAMPREDPRDAYVEYVNGAFVVKSEMAGTKLEEAALEQALQQGLSQLTVGTTAPGNLVLELSEQNCYKQPARTVANGEFDFAQELSEFLEKLKITVDFQGQTETLSGSVLEDVVSVNAAGKVKVDDAALDEMVARWHETYRNDGVPYLFNAYVGGVKPMDFLLVDYELNKEETKAVLKEAIVAMQDAQISAVWYCWRKGEAFAIEGEYVEVDIPNQKMTYVKDNEVVVSTDIVTGATWGYPTPPGYYAVQNKDTNCWLSGLDYNVHVDYWIGFIGYEYGIHDADWRTKFGGTNYVKNGSHGCVNTPKEATKLIFDNIEVGVPVLVYGK